MKNLYSNPFQGFNATQIDTDKIIEYWCNPFSYKLITGINEDDIFTDPTNIVLMGGRGTGKSMFLRYWSYNVQLKKAESDKLKLIDIVTINKGIGFYFRIDGPKLRSFQGNGIDIEHWVAVFTHYFELIIGRNYIEFLKFLDDEGSLTDQNINATFISSLCTLLDFPIFSTFVDILKEFDLRIKEVEVFLGNVPFYKNKFVPKNRGYLSQSLSFEIPELIHSKIPTLKDINIILLLDEYENFLSYQQKIVNTLLRFTRPLTKFRIGMRLEGFRTYEMISEDDFIKEGREYRTVIFEEILNKNLGYQEFLFEISKKRLESVPILKERGITDIKFILGNSEDLEQEAKEIAKSNPNKISDYFSKKLDKNDLEKIKYPQNPLLELLNCIWLTRGNSADKTLEAMNDYLNKKKHSVNGKKYQRDYIDKYKLSLTFILCSLYKENKLYYSFNTFSFLSSGIVGHFIELCRNAFSLANWGDDDKFLIDGLIKKEYQHKAAITVSNSEKQQIGRIDTYGGLISKFIENIGNIFRGFHLDIKMRYPETNQFAINIDSIQCSDKLKNALREAIKWTVIQKKLKMQRTGPSEKLQDTYTINRIFSPIFQITYRTRGGKSIKLNENSLKDLFHKDGIPLSLFLYEKKAKKDINNSPDLFSIS